MDTTVKLDDVLDLMSKHQADLALAVNAEMPGYRSHTVLWEEYRRISELYDNIRRLA